MQGAQGSAGKAVAYISRRQDGSHACVPQALAGSGSDLNKQLWCLINGANHDVK